MCDNKPPECNERSAARAGSAVAGLTFGLALLLVMPVTRAAEGATTEYVGGFAGFAAGYFPADSGTYLQNDLYFYSGGVSARGRERQDCAERAHGHRIRDTAQFTTVTSYKLLGGDFGFGAAVAAGYVNARAAIEPFWAAAPDRPPGSVI